MLIAYLVGTAIVSFVIGCCAYAANGNRMAQAASEIGTIALLSCASAGLILGSFLMLAAPQVDREGPIRWWSLGVGEQFLAACLGVIALVCAARAVAKDRYSLSAGLILAGACCFALWGLLVEGGWSGRGPFNG